METKTEPGAVDEQVGLLAQAGILPGNVPAPTPGPSVPPASPAPPANAPPVGAATDEDEIEIPAGADNPDAVRNAIKNERRAAKEANARARELQAQLDAASDAQKPLEQRIEEAGRKAQEAELRALRFEVAAETGLDLKLATRLTGTTREELTADADALKGLVGTPPPAAPPEGGYREPAPAKKDPAREHNELLGAIFSGLGAGRTDPLAQLQPAPEE